jgi:hypothetical protein
MTRGLRPAHRSTTLDEHYTANHTGLAFTGRQPGREREV